MTALLLFILFSIVSLWLFARLVLAGQDLSIYDRQVEPLFADQPASPPLSIIERALTKTEPGFNKLSKQLQLEVMRKKMDDSGIRVSTNATITTVKSDKIAGEWVIAPGADSSKRMLYIHGGAFIMGSPQSHRIVTSKLSEISGAAVFALDYRLRPEHKRLDSLEDCQNAYRWLIDNGPENGPEDSPEETTKAERLYIAGDSAGANLCLVMLAWIRDNSLPTPTAAIVLSPVTDSTLSSPSIRNNLDTDAMLKGLLQPIAKIPKTLLLLGSWLDTKIKPCDPRISPIHGDLAGLPPLLIQASDSECLEDDARRYTNKARAAGSPVTLQLWHGMMHVWHFFEPELDEAKAAFKQIELFLAAVDKGRMKD